ncbi:hypothetical protein D3C87_1134600 [compost metagenome]
MRFRVERVIIDVVGCRHVDGLHPHALGIGRFHQLHEVEFAVWIVAGPQIKFLQVVSQFFGHFSGACKAVQVELIDVCEQLLHV